MILNDGGRAAPTEVIRFLAEAVAVAAIRTSSGSKTPAMSTTDSFTDRFPTGC